MITESIVMEGIYFDEVGAEVTPPMLICRVQNGEHVPVWSEAGVFYGTVIQVRRVDNCLEALIEN